MGNMNYFKKASLRKVTAHRKDNQLDKETEDGLDSGEHREACEPGTVVLEMEDTSRATTARKEIKG